MAGGHKRGGVALTVGAASTPGAAGATSAPSAAAAMSAAGAYLLDQTTLPVASRYDHVCTPPSALSTSPKPLEKGVTES